MNRQMMEMVARVLHFLARMLESGGAGFNPATTWEQLETMSQLAAVSAGDATPSSETSASSAVPAASGPVASSTPPVAQSTPETTAAPAMAAEAAPLLPPPRVGAGSARPTTGGAASSSRPTIATPNPTVTQPVHTPFCSTRCSIVFATVWNLDHVTRTGKYHNASTCQGLAKARAVRPATLCQAVEHGLTQCSFCRFDQTT